MTTEHEQPTSADEAWTSQDSMQLHELNGKVAMSRAVRDAAITEQVNNRDADEEREARLRHAFTFDDLPFLWARLDTARLALSGAQADLDLHIGMHAVTVGEYEKLKTALAERDAEIVNLKVSINNMTAGLRQTRGEYEAEIARLTEGEAVARQPTSAADAREANIRSWLRHPYHDNISHRDATHLLGLLDAARIALAERDAEIARLRLTAQASDSNRRRVPPRADAVEIADNLFSTLLRDSRAIDYLTDAQIAERKAELASAIEAAEAREREQLVLAGWGPPIGVGAVSQSSADAVEIARQHREEFERVCQGREWANQPDDDEWWAHAIEAAEERGRAESHAEIARLKAVVEDGQSEDRVKRLVNALYHIPTRTEEAAGTIIEASDVLLFQSREIARLIDPPPPSGSALAIAEGFRVFFRRPYPTSEEGVERAVQQLAQEIGNAMRHNETPLGADGEHEAQTDADAEWEAEARKDHGHWCPIKCHVCRALCLLDNARFALAKAQDEAKWNGAIRHNETLPGRGALEATRDLFQSLEGWRPTENWTGVPPRIKLLFDRVLHAIEAAEARGRAR
jgi:hypothetical protein